MSDAASFRSSKLHANLLMPRGWVVIGLAVVSWAVVIGMAVLAYHLVTYLL